MEALLPDSVKLILLVGLAVAFALTRLARRYPGVTWLRVFRPPDLQLSEEQKARRRRFANRMAAVEFILAGLVLPLGYVALTIMMFNEPGGPAMIIVSLCSVLCIAAGIWILVRNR